jgi:hypothetical protein
MVAAIQAASSFKVAQACRVTGAPSAVHGTISSVTAPSRAWMTPAQARRMARVDR